MPKSRSKSWWHWPGRLRHIGREWFTQDKPAAGKIQRPAGSVIISVMTLRSQVRGMV
jgi:hypothetical protein